MPDPKPVAEEAPKPVDDATAIRKAFDRKRLIELCAKQDFTDEGLERRQVIYDDGKKPEDEFIWFSGEEKNKVLFVAHLDSVQDANWCRVMSTPIGPIAYSPVLDDRLGVYVGLDLLPKLGLNYDILLTTNEEKGASTAQNFYPKGDYPKQYNWMFSFDRGYKDVALYGYKDWDTDKLVKAADAEPTRGANSCIAYLEHLKCKGFNWGVCYRDYHNLDSHVYLTNTFTMVEKFLTFWDTNSETYLEHKESKFERKSYGPYERYGDHTDQIYVEGRGMVEVDKRFYEGGKYHVRLKGEKDFRIFDYYQYPIKKRDGSRSPKDDREVPRIHLPGPVAGYWGDSLDDQIHLLEAGLADEEDDDLPAEHFADNVIAPDYTITKRERREQKAIIEKMGLHHMKAPALCPRCSETLITGYCHMCAEDWLEAIYYYKRQRNMAT